MSSREILIRNSNIYFNIDDNTTKRYYIFNWKTKHNAQRVKITASINIDKNVDEEMNYDNNIDTAPIYQSASTQLTDKYLDYDVFSKEFELDINDSNILEAKIDEPTPKGYLFNSNWISSTTGDLSWNLEDKYGLVKDSKLNDINNQYGAINDSSNNIIRMPVVRWITNRLGFGYSKSTGIYSNKGDLKYTGDNKDNGKAPQIDFSISTFGNISRNAENKYYTGYYYHSHSDSCYTETTNSEGKKTRTRTCGESEGDHYYGYTTETVTQRADFLPKPVKDNVRIQALIYNGSSLPLQDYSDDIGVTKSNGGWDNTLIWEGDRYQIPVTRYMRELDVMDQTISLVETPGNYGKTRTFQHLDQAK
ncbi:hypothetical protein EHE19_005030 [Ruminiclostridium herbifermentans]|uniref:Uncharacterized protein n=1 Tax=Ruminiclostridium herbifermentans TaxID=2488810 RepID=A0A4U7JGT7_9FIRM|nr:hypothetical protein [Ruminiclostridium herbifermentans]QNU67826.1 hypothetical protein EHE19_005030 [Ruminiclostridium herbifermentans]